MITTDNRPNLQDLMGKAIELPVLPATTQKVLSQMSDPDVSIEKIKRLISADPGLATKILTVANSAFYGGFRNIQNLSQAILRLGLSSVRNVVVAVSMKNVYKRFGLTEKLLWEQMMGSALVANLTARATRLADPEDAFIGGLLHDVGKIVMNNEYPESFSRVIERVYNDSVDFSLAEKDHFNFTHREVGATVVKKWGFPESLELLVLHFEDSEYITKDRQLYNLVTIIMFADKICQKFGMGWRTAGGEVVQYGNLPGLLGLDDDKIKKIEIEAQEAFGQNLQLF